jgi:chromosome segregation ATPase
MTTKIAKTTKASKATKAKPKPAPAPIATPAQPEATSAADLQIQCERRADLIDALSLQMAEIEEQHQAHETAFEQMQSEQEVRHESYDALTEAISATSERITGLTMSLTITRGTPGEASTKQQLEQHTRALAEHKHELAELEALDKKQGEHDAKSTAKHEQAIEQLEEQYASLETQLEELQMQRDTLYESWGWQIYQEYSQATAKLEQQIAETDAKRRGAVQVYDIAIAELRKEALQDLQPWEHIRWRLESLQKGIDSRRVDEQHERQPLVIVLRAHQAYLRALQTHGNALRQRRFGNVDLVAQLAVSQQLIGEALLKEVDFKASIDTDEDIMRKHA